MRDLYVKMFTHVRPFSDVFRTILEPLNPPIPVTTRNNQVFSLISYQTGPITLVTSGNISLLIFTSLDSPLILGFPWLKKHTPHSLVASWSLFCLANYFNSALPSEPIETKITEPVLPNLTTVPQEYHDLQEVFSKHIALSLPPHIPYDCAIDFLPGAPLFLSAVQHL